MKPEKETIPLHTLKKTCHGCPMVWEGHDQNGTQEVYIRYRHGCLSMAVGGETVMSIRYITICGADGVIDQNEMISLVNKHTNYRIKQTKEMIGPE